MAADHLIAWRLIAEAGTLPGFAHMTLLRSVIEGTSVANWLLGSPDSAERGRRAAIFRLEDQRQRREFELATEAFSRSLAEAAGEVFTPFAYTGTAKSGAERYDEQIARMTAAGVTPQRPPSLTSLVDEYGPGAPAYRLTSAFVHRREWAMALSDELDRRADAVPGGGLLLLEPSVGWAATITELAVEALLDAVGRFEQYVGIANE